MEKGSWYVIRGVSQECPSRIYAKRVLYRRMLKASLKRCILVPGVGLLRADSHNKFSFKSNYKNEVQILVATPKSLTFLAEKTI